MACVRRGYWLYRGGADSRLRDTILPEISLDWLKANFYKTELELGHCLDKAGLVDFA